MDLVEHMFTGVAKATPLEIRAAIAGLQEHILDMPESLPEESCPVRHVFAPGVYAREIHMPAGMVVIGKIHKHAHVNIISKGKVRVLTEGGRRDYTAPCTFVSDVGNKRLVNILEDCIWTTIHPTNSTDLAEIEREVIAEDYSEELIPVEQRRE